MRRLIPILGLLLPALLDPDNGWALHGLVQALRAQGKDEQAAAVERRFEQAWERADVELGASRIR